MKEEVGKLQRKEEKWGEKKKFEEDGGGDQRALADA